MKFTIITIVLILAILAIIKFSNFNFASKLNAQNKQNEASQMYNYPMSKTEEEWKKNLTPEQYSVLREKATDRPFTGKYEAFWEEGDYKCAACGNVLFSSSTKFDAHCGWPSFSEVKEQGKVKEIVDTSHGMVRTEVVCANCGGHLGHLFDDGPKPTGQRYCINSTSINFQKKDTVK